MNDSTTPFSAPEQPAGGEQSRPWTAGPWYVEQHNTTLGQVKYRPVYVQPLSLQIGRDDRALADAHLIAAAPQMAEALADLYSSAKSLAGDIGVHDAHPIWDAIEAAEAALRAAGASR